MWQNAICLQRPSAALLQGRGLIFKWFAKPLSLTNCQLTVGKLTIFYSLLSLFSRGQVGGEDSEMINEKTAVNTTSFFSDLVDSSHPCHPGLTSQVLGRFTQEASPMPRKECHQLAMALGAGVTGPSGWFHQGWGERS